VIQTIWSRCVRATRRMAGRPVISGTPPTAASSASISPMERSLHEQLSAHWGRPNMDRLVYAWWSTKATILHWFGIHTMLPLEEWDFTEEVVQLKGSICWKCDHTTR